MRSFAALRTQWEMWDALLRVVIMLRGERHPTEEGFCVDSMHLGLGPKSGAFYPGRTPPRNGVLREGAARRTAPYRRSW
jgi:hypothetical protein